MDDMQLAVTKDERERLYEGVLRTIQKTPASRCMVEHAQKPIPITDLVKKVRGCKIGAKEGRITLKECKDIMKKLEDKSILFRVVLPQSDEWHYEASPLTKAIMTRAKGQNSARRHL